MNCRRCPDAIAVQRGPRRELICVFSGAEVPPDDQPTDLVCPRMLDLASADGRQIARTVMVVALRRRVHERLVSRYPVDVRERLIALLLADGLDAAVHDLEPSEEARREAWLDSLGAEDIRRQRPETEAGEEGHPMTVACEKATP